MGWKFCAFLCELQGGKCISFGGRFDQPERQTQFVFLHTPVVHRLLLVWGSHEVREDLFLDRVNMFLFWMGEFTRY